MLYIHIFYHNKKWVFCSYYDRIIGIRLFLLPKTWNWTKYIRLPFGKEGWLHGSLQCGSALPGCSARTRSELRPGHGSAARCGGWGSERTGSLRAGAGGRKISRASSWVLMSPLEERRLCKLGSDPRRVEVRVEQVLEFKPFRVVGSSWMETPQSPSLARTDHAPHWDLRGHSNRPDSSSARFWEEGVWRWSAAMLQRPWEQIWLSTALPWQLMKQTYSTPRWAASSQALLEQRPFLFRSRQQSPNSMQLNTTMSCIKKQNEQIDKTAECGWH